MLNINLDNLNQLEHSIYDKIYSEVEKDKNLSIINASQICDVSSSKISKTVKKLGFKNYKEFIKFCKGELVTPETSPYSDELKRLAAYIESFDYSIVEKFIDKISNYQKIIIYGLGPSFICAQYFEYKLRLFTDKSVIAMNDEIQIKNIVDSETLFIIFSVTGQFSSFENICNIVNNKNGEVLIVFEEYNNNHYPYVSDIIYLTEFKQEDNFEPYQKSRSILFIFIEEVLRKYLVT